MKTKIIDCLKKKVLLVDGLHEDITTALISNNNGVIHYVEKDIRGNLTRGKEYLDFPPGNWQYLSLLSEVTWDQCEELVEDTQYYDPHGQPYPFISVFKGYTDNVWKWSPKESFLSALEATHILLSNPYKTPTCGCGTEFDREGCPDKCWEYINAEANVFTPNQTLIFIEQ